MKIRRSLLCWCFVLFHSTTTTTANIFQQVNSVRSLPNLILCRNKAIPSSSSSSSTAAVPLLQRRRFSPQTTSKNHNHNHHQQSPAAQLVASVKERVRSTASYYGIPERIVVSSVQGRSSSSQGPKSKPESLDVMMNHALLELKGMRQEMSALRQELRAMKRQMGHDVEADHSNEQHQAPTTLLGRIQKQRDWDNVGLEIERWAENLLFEEGSQDGEDGWKEIKVSKLCASFNKDNNVKCYMKWMKDSRGEHATEGDDLEYPCIKLFATLDAPMEQVCEYLADEKSLPEYNSLVVKHRDLEDITPHSKVCWGQSPKILFIKPRDFVTFCHHRWLRDGTQVIVNQACNHENYAHAMKDSGEKTGLKAFALRGANFISPDPEDPNKTRFSLISHANPGPDISPWMCRLAVNNLAPIEPFKLVYYINKNVQRYELDPNRTQLVNSNPGRSTRPGGLSQMGYACFWPKGGGLKEGFIHSPHPDHVDPLETHTHHHVNDNDEAKHTMQ